VPVTTTGDLTVFGDVVRVHGILSAPGRTIRIFCRRLEFYAGKTGSGISVNGDFGADGAEAESAASAGADGQLNPTSIPATNGITGADGGHGNPGNPGGEIQIYCDTLVPLSAVVLSAEGGKGGNGAVGQQGGQGGNGFSGYPMQRYDLGNGRFTDNYFGDRAYGGYGGCGGNGGNGGNGGAGGRITLHFMRLGNPDGGCKITASTAGGFGGNGAQAGVGGKGGDGGRPDPQRGPSIGADAGGGGTCGLPGQRGHSAPIGTVYLGIPLPVKPGTESKSFLNFHWDYLYSANTEDEKAFLERLIKSIAVFVPDKPRIGQPGQPFADPNQAAPAGKPGPGGVARSPSLLRNKQVPTEGPTVVTPQITAHRTLTYRDLAALADLDQLEMLFDFTRGRYLLTNTRTVSDQVLSLIDVMTWVVMLSESKDSKLLATAAATLENLGKGRTIFGKNAQFAALGSLSRYQSALKSMLELFAPVEQTSKLLSSAENGLTERRLYLENAVSAQRSLVERLTQARTNKVAETKAARAQVQTLDAGRKALAGELAENLEKFEGEIERTVHLTPADFVNLFSQLSFTNRELTHPAGVAGAAAGVSPAGVAATGAMLLSQTIDVVTKAIENVPTDLGGSLNRKFVIRRMEFLGGAVKDLGSLKQTREGLLKADPSAEYRLLATRDQVESICSNFYEKCPAAKAIFPNAGAVHRDGSDPQ